MSIYLTFLALAIIEIFIIDISGAMDGLVKPIIRRILGLSKTANITIPLFECSLCVVFHTGWIFLLCTGQFTIINFLFTTLIAFFSKNIAGFMRWTQDILIYIEELLYKIITK